jgi:hypothetical protein
MITLKRSYLEKMHNEIIKTPVKETSKSLHNKFGYLGYLREEVYDGQSCVMKYYFLKHGQKIATTSATTKERGRRRL